VKIFKQVCFGAATIAVMSAGSTLIADSAQALSLNGLYKIDVTTTILNPGTNTPTLKFTNATINTKTGDFAGLSGTPVIANLALTDPGQLNNTVAKTSTYFNSAVSNFIDLGGGLTFDLDASNVNLLGFITNPSKFSIAGPINGVFKQGGSVVGDGFLGIASGSNGSTISLFADSTAIPTPALLPGLVGMGIATMRRKRKQTAVQA
jgi:hypothetical protein